MNVTSSVVNSSLVTAVQQSIAPWISQTIRLSSSSPYIEFEWTVGPIPVDDGQGKELVTRFTTAIASNASWYTDSNAREFQQRVRDYRPTWRLNVTEPVACNFFPVTSSVWMADQHAALVLSVDRSEGASSLADGQLELMLHRRTLRSDDGETVEALNETDAIESDGRTRIGRGLVVKGSFLLSLTAPNAAAYAARTTHQTQYSAPALFFAPLSGSVPAYLSSHIASASFLSRPLPPNLELITYQAVSASRVLFRLAHIFAAGEAGQLGEPVEVELLSLFVQPLTDCAELSLTANSAAGSHVPLVWRVQGEEGEEQRPQQASAGARLSAAGSGTAGATITVSPMEVRTFQCTMQPLAPPLRRTAAAPPVQQS